MDNTKKLPDDLREETKGASAVQTTDNPRVLIRTENLKKHFPIKGSKFPVRAVDGVDLEIYEGETFGLVGESGCGKSTLGRTILRLYEATEGKVSYLDQDLSKHKTEAMRKLRRELQVIFQDPYSSLNPRLTVGQVISEALVAHDMFKRGSQELEDYTIDIMEKCGLQNYMIHRYPHQFSGGQRQRIGIARALALNPTFVVCDEAVSALDVSIQSQIINLLMDLKDDHKLTYLFISHDLSAVKFISDRIAVMYLGDIIELSSSEEIFSGSMHPYTRALIKAIPTTDEDSGKELMVLEGDIPSPINPPSGCKFHTRCRYCQEICRTKAPEFRELRPGHKVACHFPLMTQDD